jgi:phosphoesterase RecJ-like protein
VSINEVAAQYRGGGHALASGATLSSLEELSSLLDLLKQEVKKQL